jgi:hypothetical protein
MRHSPICRSGARWLAVLIVLSGLGVLAAALLRASDGGRAMRVAGAALGLLGVALAVTWLGPREAPSGLTTVA